MIVISKVSTNYHSNVHFSGKPTAIVKPCNKTLPDEKDTNYESTPELKSEDNKLKDILPSEMSEILPKEMENNFELTQNMKPEVADTNANVTGALETEKFINDPILDEKMTPSKENIVMDKGKNPLIRIS